MEARENKGGSRPQQRYEQKPRARAMGASDWERVRAVRCESGRPGGEKAHTPMGPQTRVLHAPYTSSTLALRTRQRCAKAFAHGWQHFEHLCWQCGHEETRLLSGTLRAPNRTGIRYRIRYSQDADKTGHARSREEGRSSLHLRREALPGVCERARRREGLSGARWRRRDRHSCSAFIV